MKKKRSPEEERLWKTLFILLSAGWIMIFSIIGCTLLGVYIDHRLGHEKPVFSVAAILVGIAAGYLFIWRKISGFFTDHRHNETRDDQSESDLEDH